MIIWTELYTKYKNNTIVNTLFLPKGGGGFQKTTRFMSAHPDNIKIFHCMLCSMLVKSLINKRGFWIIITSMLNYIYNSNYVIGWMFDCLPLYELSELPDFWNTLYIRKIKVFPYIKKTIQKKSCGFHKAFCVDKGVWLKLCWKYTDTGIISKKYRTVECYLQHNFNQGTFHSNPDNTEFILKLVLCESHNFFCMVFFIYMEKPLFFWCTVCSKNLVILTIRRGVDNQTSNQ